MLMAAAAGGVNLLLYSSCAESEPAVRMHQLINRLRCSLQPACPVEDIQLTHSVGDGQLTALVALEDHSADNRNSLELDNINKILLKCAITEHYLKSITSSLYGRRYLVLPLLLFRLFGKVVLVLVLALLKIVPLGCPKGH